MLLSSHGLGLILRAQAWKQPAFTILMEHQVKANVSITLSRN